jgi:hypothetical protein
MKDNHFSRLTIYIFATVLFLAAGGCERIVNSYTFTIYKHGYSTEMRPCLGFSAYLSFFTNANPDDLSPHYSLQLPAVSDGIFDSTTSTCKFTFPMEYIEFMYYPINKCNSIGYCECCDLSYYDIKNLPSGGLCT